MSNGPRFPKTELEKDLTPVHFKDGKYGKFLFLYGKYQLAKLINRSENAETEVNQFIQKRVGRGI